MLIERISGNSINSLQRMHSLREQLNQMFAQDESYSVPSQFPPINVWGSDEGAIVEAELPGVELSDIEITLLSDSLTLKGSRAIDPQLTGKVYFRQERLAGNFARTIRLPFKIDTEKVKAELAKGILQITLPRAEADKPRKIEVKSL